MIPESDKEYARNRMFDNEEVRICGRGKIVRKWREVFIIGHCNRDDVCFLRKDIKSEGPLQVQWAF
ncbi:hypothetical protein DF182_19675 [Chitinophaga flava]|uniref:Uncharacterized protein n=1 Tax=Chitinophaga flava TaxID=2259036 RepID=A0A365XR00_9BACT|nr:hypothetical protein DF182_19675 [Chitinophaga flava]